LKTFFPAPHRHPTASTDPTDPTDLRTSPGPPAAPPAPAAPLAPGGLGSLVAENPKGFSIDWGTGHNDVCIYIYKCYVCVYLSIYMCICIYIYIY
jgi:hypothetical protein